MSRKIYRVKVRRFLAAMKRLYDEGVALPSFTISRTRIAYGPTTGRLFVAVGGKRYASISRGGIVRPVIALTRFDIAVIQAVVENPLDVARGAAILSGFAARCPVCGRVLDAKDRLRGIGPKCYEKGEFWRLETKKSVRVIKGKKQEKMTWHRKQSERTSRTKSRRTTNS